MKVANAGAALGNAVGQAALETARCGVQCLSHLMGEELRANLATSSK